MSTPCGACKSLKKKCTEDCVFAPYFPADKLDAYVAVHKVFGSSQVAKLLNTLDHPSQREEAMNALTFEAQARLQDPVHGCSRFINYLQDQIKDREHQFQIVKNQVALASYNIVPTIEPPPPVTFQQYYHNHMMMPNASYNCFTSTQTAQMQQTPERQTQHNERDMLVGDKKIIPKI